MTFTYNANPAAEPVDAVRLLVGDHNASEYFLQDEEIAWLHDTWINKGNVYFVAAKAAETIAAKFARETTFTADGQTVSLSELQDKYLALATSLREQAEELLVGGSSLHAGGMDAHQWVDPSVAPLAFGTGMHDHREAGLQDYGDYGSAHWPDSSWGEYVP